MRLLQRFYRRLLNRVRPNFPDLPVDFVRLESRIGYRIRDRNHFYRALLHRSYLQYPQGRNLKSNERLEFLGDSILNLVAGEYLYHNFPDATEGELTKIRARLVNRRALARYAKELDLWDFILMSSATAQTLNKGSDSILADAYEAIIAAIYLDGGYQEAKRFVEQHILAAAEKGPLDAGDENYKSMLLEYSQAHGLGLPRYNIMKEEGPDHDRTFTVEVVVGNRSLGIGVGKNKKAAEQNAAARAMQNIGTRSNHTYIAK
ncbi:MAG: ribonuclease III [Bacteroidota bacterium]